jgi:hypothetical protein
MAGMNEEMKKEMRAAAAMAVASAQVDKVIEDRKAPKKIPRKIPPPVVRSVVLVQSCLRRKAFLRSFGEHALEDEELAELAPPPPLTAVALYMCRRMRNPKFVDVDTEARSVAGIVVSKENVTMDVIANVVWFYEGTIDDDHPAIITLREKLAGLTIKAHEVLQLALDICQTPAEVHKEVEYSRKTFKVLPELEDKVFSCAARRMQHVTRDADLLLRREIAKSITTLDYVANGELLESIYGPVETPVRDELRVASIRRVQFLERELTTRWSRPFAGPLPPHTRASQRYLLELGLVPKVEEFLALEKNHAAVLEAQFEVKLSEQQGILKNLTLRRKDAKARSLIQDLDAKLSDATVKLQHLIEEALINLGPDNKKVLQKARILLSQEAHIGVFAMFAETQAEELRNEIANNDPAPEAADRRRGIAVSMVAALDELIITHPMQAELRGEFGEEISALAATRPSTAAPSKQPVAQEPAGESPLDATAPSVDSPAPAVALPVELTAPSKAAAPALPEPSEPPPTASGVEASAAPTADAEAPAAAQARGLASISVSGLAPSMIAEKIATPTKARVAELAGTVSSGLAQASVSGVLAQSLVDAAAAETAAAAAAAAAEPAAAEPASRDLAAPAAPVDAWSSPPPVAAPVAASSREPAGFLSAIESPSLPPPSGSNVVRGGVAAVPLSPGQATEDEPEGEDPWYTPLGFEDIKAKDDIVQPLEKFKIPGADGAPIADATKSIYVPAPETVLMMQSFDADTIKDKGPIHAGVTAQLTLQDLTMDVVELHTEQVFAAKFRRAVADACGIPPERVQVLGFEPGSVKVLLKIAEPAADEVPIVPEAEARRRKGAPTGPKTAAEVLSELSRQVADPASRLRLGEVGPFVSSAVVERGLSTTSKKVEHASLDQAYVAPPLGGKPGGPTLAWTAGTEAGATLSGADTTAYPSGGTAW